MPLHPSFLEMHRTIPFGGSLVTTTRKDFPPSELPQMMRITGLNTLCMYPSYLTNLLNYAREDEYLLQTLQQLRAVKYTGSVLAPDVLSWAHEHGISIGVSFPGHLASSINRCMRSKSLVLRSLAQS